MLTSPPPLLCPRLLCLPVFECWRLPRSDPTLYGELQSPQYPQPYPGGLTETWDLQVPEGFQIQLTFTHLDIEPSANCYYDAVTVSERRVELTDFLSASALGVTLGNCDPLCKKRF